MRVLMLGWEFPPYISGGLGTACHGLVKALSAAGTDVLFLLPRAIDPSFKASDEALSCSHIELAPPLPAANPAHPHEFDHVTFRAIDANLNPYQRAGDASQDGDSTTRQHGSDPYVQIPQLERQLYGGDLFNEVQRYADHAVEVARDEPIDVIHAHDWMTFPAAMAIAGMKGKPLVVHVHSTELDRAGASTDTRIYDIERRGMHSAMRIITVSCFTKDVLVKHYGLEPNKIDVIYNAVETDEVISTPAEDYSILRGEKLVLFLGRITSQKGPEYFLAAAKKVLEVMDNVKFVMAGSGDMMRESVELAAEFGIGHKVLFTGFLRGPDVERIFRMADLYVMPSVSEPFGIAPLEAIANDVPVLISKQSGVSEVLPHALKVDFWDTHEMANKIVAVLRHPPLALMLREQGTFELSKLSWADSARACVTVYKRAIAMMR